jgi:lipooligosaccharide transport system permease protein
MTIRLHPESDREIAERTARVRRIGSWYVTEHQLRITLRYGAVTLATTIGTPFLYLFAFGIGLGALVSASGTVVDGVSYLAFVAPALICTATMTIATGEFTFPIMLGFRWNPIFIGMNAAPLSGNQIISGHVLFVTIRMVTTAVVYYLVMLLFGAVPSAWGVMTVPIAVLTGLAFGAPILAYATRLKEETGQFSIISRVILLPLTLFSGTVFPLEQLPIYLQWVGWISPLWHGTELARQFSYGVSEPIWLSAAHLIYLVLLSVVFIRLAMRFAVQRLDK